MPPIFNVQQREELKIRLLEIGFSMIKESGLKKTTIDKITQAASIAKGTFYHFYPSKELFVYEIMVYLRDGFKKNFEERINEKGYLTREEAMEWTLEIAKQEKSLYAYLTPEDIEWMQKKLPSRNFYNPEGDKDTIKILLSHIEGVRPDIDYRIVANFPKIAAIALENKTLLHQEVLHVNLKMILQQMYAYIFGD